MRGYCKDKNIDQSITDDEKDRGDGKIKKISKDNINYGPFSILESKSTDIISSEINPESHLQTYLKTDDKLAALAIKKIQEDYQLYQSYKVNNIGNAGSFNITRCNGVGNSNTGESQKNLTKLQRGIDSGKNLITYNIKDEYLHPTIPKLLENKGKDQFIYDHISNHGEEGYKYFDFYIYIDTIEVNFLMNENIIKDMKPYVEILIVNGEREGEPNEIITITMNETDITENEQVTEIRKNQSFKTYKFNTVFKSYFY